MLTALHRLLSIIKNGYDHKLLFVTCQNKRTNIQILNVLQEHGYISAFRFKQHKKYKKVEQIEILLKYTNEKPVIQSYELISKPNTHVFKTVKDLQYMQQSLRIQNYKKGKTQIYLPLSN